MPPPSPSSEAAARAAGWEHFPHGADVGVRGLGLTKAEAFEQVALALTAVLTPPEVVRLSEAVEIDVTAPDDEILLVQWLNALIYEMATRGMLFGAFRVMIERDRLSATATGEAVDITRHEPAVEVKGATLTAVKVEQTPDGRWLAQCVLDV
jgi:SHS2 domain-containing protein